MALQGSVLEPEKIELTDAQFELMVKDKGLTLVELELLKHECSRPCNEEIVSQYRFSRGPLLVAWQKVRGRRTPPSRFNL